MTTSPDSPWEIMKNLHIMPPDKPSELHNKGHFKIFEYAGRAKL